MAQYPVKLLANIGVASPNAGGNQGTYSPVYTFQYYEFGTPAARTAIPFASSPCTGTVIGVAAGIGTTATTITYDPKKIPCTSGATVALTSTLAVIASTATGPAVTSTIAYQGQAATTVKGQNGATTATGITDAVLHTTLANRQCVQGDLIGITTSGTFTSGVGLFSTVFLRDDDGAY